MPRKAAKESRELDHEVETFDPDGDVIIVAKGKSLDDDKRFLLSSKLLSLASLVFAKFFGPNFYEGAQVATCTCPEIPLYDDDPDLMRVLLALLHYQEPEEIPYNSTEWLAKLAIHCDKYDCVKALRPWVSNWIYEFESIYTLMDQEFGYLILATHLFRSSDHFSKLTAKVQADLPPGFALEWESF
ncbi:uncharacterized protein N7479_005372 [Penicillium vulpinum]|uniref:BTB domain-containing protein n=1 Tax=Penicillium vulpinum TaxID=29845 RepID=A0A1V6RL38_9EURO|nr:uncharacterized protein N7479_005372 [Penicillium vulpinum]KAJ5958222.1 hypothetical protein N7479_005372 [Penicillium vulpinum]OQE02164.1 hypothetical protein PENVUL_c040G05350 [Penicillium vulpinum]